MLNGFRTTRVLVLAGDGVAVFDVRRGLVGSACGDVSWASDLTDRTSADQVRRAVMRAGGAGAVCVVLPSKGVHTRPMGMSTPVFRAARSEVLRNLGTLLPLEPKDAAIGFVDRIDQVGEPGEGEERAGAGYLIAAEAGEVERAREFCREMTGREPDRMVSVHQALLGAGFQGSDVRVRERGVYGESLDTVIEGGLIRELRSDAEADASRAPDFEIPDRVGEDTIDALRRLAIGAVLVDANAPSAAEPLSGQWTPMWKRLVPGVAAVLICAALVAGAWSVRQARYQEAVDLALAEQDRIAERVRQAEGLQRELDDLARDLNAARLPALVASEDGAVGVLGVMEGVRSVLPADAQLEWVSVDGNGVRMRGIASSAREVLGALESSLMFRNARESDRPSPLGDGSGREVFAVAVSYAERGAADGGDDDDR
ncbi:MAG: hypothetical protein ACF8MJ_11900 [Phycisphaerales bacterium JB050]